MDLTGKTALITGSTSGIGLCIAHALAKAGSNILITGFGDVKTIDAIVDAIKSKYNVEAKYFGADLRSVDEIKVLISNISADYPAGIDILINNAGCFDYSNIEDLPDNKWDDLLAINLTAPFQLIKAFLPDMKKKGWGRIVNTSSIVGHVSIYKETAYTATKHGLIGLTKGVALEGAKYGVTCNAVCPGSVDTQMGDLVRQYVAEDRKITVEEQRDRAKAAMPTGQYVEPEQVAELVLFLVASGSSNQMTGASYMIDGGYTTQ